MCANIGVPSKLTNQTRVFFARLLSTNEQYFFDHLFYPFYSPSNLTSKFLRKNRFSIRENISSQCDILLYVKTIDKRKNKFNDTGYIITNVQNNEKLFVTVIFFMWYCTVVERRTSIDRRAARIVNVKEYKTHNREEAKESINEVAVNSENVFYRLLIY